MKGIISAVISCVVVMPIWFYIVYTLLSVAHVDRLVWFLFIIYMPASMTSTILAVQALKEKK